MQLKNAQDVRGQSYINEKIYSTSLKVSFCDVFTFVGQFSKMMRFRSELSEVRKLVFVVRNKISFAHNLRTNTRQLEGVKNIKNKTIDLTFLAF